jgi:hypothetical protein
VLACLLLLVPIGILKGEEEKLELMWRNTVARWTALSKHPGAAGSKYFAGEGYDVVVCQGGTSRSRTSYRLLLAVPGSETASLIS